jgi:hypothetical protein
MYVRHSIAEQRARGWSRLRRHKTTLPIFAHFPMRGCCSNRVNPHRPTRNDKSVPTARVLCAGPVNFIHTPYVLGTGGSVKGWAPLRGVFWFGIVVCVLYLTRTFLGQILPPAFISEVRLHYSPHM